VDGFDMTIPLAKRQPRLVRGIVSASSSSAAAAAAAAAADLASTAYDAIGWP
jgi:hypothetical protein